MARIEYNKSDTGKRVTGPVRALTSAQKVEDLKLGKFAECDVMHLPEKKMSRKWQIVLGIGLLLVTAGGAYLLFLISLAFNDEWVDVDWAILALMISGLAITTLSALVASVMLFLKKRVPVLLWYILVIAVVVGIVILSNNVYVSHEAQICYEKYPEMVNAGYGCPNMTGSAVGLALWMSLVFVMGLVVIYAIHRRARRVCAVGKR